MSAFDVDTFPSGYLCTCRLLLWCALFAVGPICGCGNAQPLTPEPTPDSSFTSSGRWVPSFRTMGQDALNIVTAPFTLSSSQQLFALGASGLVISSIAALDRPAYRRVSANDGAASRVTNPLTAPGRWYDRIGPDRMALGTAGVLAASGLVLQRRHMTRTSVRVLEAVLYTKLVTGLAKSAINRSRPVASGDAPFTAAPGSFSSDHSKLSMPSGHTARAFAVASVLSHQYDHWYVSAPAYGAAASVGVERVRSGDHWLTDVMVGGALGYLIGRTVTASPPEPDEVSYTPILGVDRFGLSIRF